MDKQERKEKVAELRKHHENVITSEMYFCCKHAHYPDDMPEEKCIGLFASEIGKGDNVYLEFVTMDYTPSDATRRLYVWKHQSDYVTRYNQNKKTGQYLIPVSELHVVNSGVVQCKLPIEGKVFQDDVLFSEMTARDFFAMLHRTPISNKKVINDMINTLNK